MAKAQVEALQAAREYIVECRPSLMFSRWKTLQRYFDLLRQIDNAIRVEEVMKALAPPKDGAPTLRHTLGAPANCPACKAAAAGVLPSDGREG